MSIKIRSNGFPSALRLLCHFARQAAVLGDLHFQIHLLKDLTKHDVDIGDVFCQKHPTMQGYFVLRQKTVLPLRSMGLGAIAACVRPSASRHRSSG